MAYQKNATSTSKSALSSKASANALDVNTAYDITDGTASNNKVIRVWAATVSTFYTNALNLTDGTFGTYVGDVFTAQGGGGGTAWGSITGTLSAQTDLQTELDGLIPLAGTTSPALITGELEFDPLLSAAAIEGIVNNGGGVGTAKMGFYGDAVTGENPGLIFQSLNPAATSSGLLQLFPNSSTFLASDPTGDSSLALTGTTAVIAGTFSTFAGIEYAADYSANYTSRSLVDKGYVDSVVGVQSVSGLTVDNTDPINPIIKPVHSFFNGVPGASEDDTLGYIANQSRVVDYNTQTTYLCIDSTTATAVWVPLITTVRFEVTDAEIDAGTAINITDLPEVTGYFWAITNAAIQYTGTTPYTNIMYVGIISKDPQYDDAGRLVTGTDSFGGMADIRSDTGGGNGDCYAEGRCQVTFSGTGGGGGDGVAVLFLTAQLVKIAA